MMAFSHYLTAILLQESPARTYARGVQNNITADAPGVEQGRAATTSRPTIWDHRHYTNLVRIASSLRADMIFGKDRRD